MITSDVFHLFEGNAPLMVSVPHAGTVFPPELVKKFHPQFLEKPIDTDWFVDQLYGFAKKMDVTLITAKYSRYVIDLNRDPQGSPLYSDQRVQTAALPVQTFDLQPLYQKTADQPNADEILRRKTLYFDPYHQEISKQLNRLKSRYSNVLLYDGHSIKRSVPSISPNRFPDMILGNRDGAACSEKILQSAQTFLQTTSHSLNINSPFKGGQITRHFGQPDQGIHALQMEMSQDIYMNEAEAKMDEERFSRTQDTLMALFQQLLKTLHEMNKS